MDVANAAALAQFQANSNLAIILDPASTTTNTWQTYAPGQGGMAYDATQWLGRGNVAQGDPGSDGVQGSFFIAAYRNSSVPLTAAPIDGSFTLSPRSQSAPTDYTNTPTVPGAGEDTYAVRAPINPTLDTYPLTPTWSVPYEIGNPAGAQSAQAAAEAAQIAAETAETNAETAETNAETAQTNAETARGGAETAETNAETAETNAETARDQAQTARDEAQTARDQAQEAASQAAQDSDGTALFGSDDPPAASFGNDGDSYWTSGTPHKVYKKASGAWALQFSLSGGGGGGDVVTDDIYWGTSADAIPIGSELTIAAVNGVAEIPAYVGGMRVLVARLDTEGDLTSILRSDDVSNINQLGGFTKYAGTVIPTGETEAFAVWVSNQSLDQTNNVTWTAS